jgi:hypothetical protein
MKKIAIVSSLLAMCMLACSDGGMGPSGDVSSTTPTPTPTVDAGVDVVDATPVVPVVDTGVDVVDATPPVPPTLITTIDCTVNQTPSGQVPQITAMSYNVSLYSDGSVIPNSQVNAITRTAFTNSSGLAVAPTTGVWSNDQNVAIFPDQAEFSMAPLIDTGSAGSWVVSMNRQTFVITCIYYNAAGTEMLSFNIPAINNCTAFGTGQSF